MRTAQQNSNFAFEAGQVRLAQCDSCQRMHYGKVLGRIDPAQVGPHGTHEGGADFAESRFFSNSAAAEVSPALNRPKRLSNFMVASGSADKDR